jgi:hypothetical protein
MYTIKKIDLESRYNDEVFSYIVVFSNGLNEFFCLVPSETMKELQLSTGLTPKKVVISSYISSFDLAIDPIKGTISPSEEVPLSFVLKNFSLKQSKSDVLLTANVSNVTIEDLQLENLDINAYLNSIQTILLPMMRFSLRQIEV